MVTSDDEALDLEPLQSQLYIALKLKSDVLAQMYFCALQVFSQAANEHRLYLVAHAIREMMKKLPAVIDVPVDASANQRLGDAVNNVRQKLVKMSSKGRWPGDPKSKWQGKIDEELRKFLLQVEAMLESGIRINRSRRSVVQSLMRKQNFNWTPLPRDIEDLRAGEWIECQDYFVKTAHYNPTNETIFLSYLRRFEYFLLNCLEPRTFEIQAGIKDIIEKGELVPTKEHVEAALNKIQRTADYNFFFENLNSPNWLEPLDELKQFNQPSELIVDRNFVRYPFWPPAKYLVKIAEEQPNKVMQIILKVPPTKNPRIHEDFVEAALKMPPEVSVKLSKNVIGWLEALDADLILLSFKAVAYAVHIKSGGFTEEALQLANTLLGFKKCVNQVDEDRSSRGRQLDSILGSEWGYNKALQEIAQSYQKKDKVNLIKVLCEKLHQAIFLEERERDQSFRDCSYIWRTSIEGSDSNHEYSIKDIIINWIRDLSENLFEENPESIATLCDYLRSLQLPIFSRLALHLARLSARADLSSKLILDYQLFSCLDVWHEYALLIEAAYPLLTLVEQDGLLAMIEVNAIYRGEGTLQANEEDNERSQYFYYYMIRHYLTGKAKKSFERLYAKFGDIEHATFHAYYSSVWIGPTSPKLKDELNSLSMLELRRFLNEWVPADKRNFGPSIEGLARELEQVVLYRPDEFLDNLGKFKLKEKTYVRAIIQGFSRVLAEKKSLKWDRVVEYLLWASRQRNGFENNLFKSGDNRDPSWSWTQQAVCRLLESGLRLETNELPIMLRKQIWEILSFGLSDMDPKVGEEDRYTSEGNYYQTAINSVRSVALEATICYAFWVKKNLGLDKGELPVEEAPELFTTLDCHLNVNVEKSKAVRAVYGKWIPWFPLLNERWFQSNKETILPREEALQDYWRAAWNAHILFNQPYIDTFKELKEHYLLAINSIELSEQGEPSTIDERLVDHLMVLFLYGGFELGSDIFVKLYAKINLGLRKHALEVVGRILTNKQLVLAPGIIERAITFWNFRVDECKKLEGSTERIEELVGFGWWIKSGQFDEGWALEQIVNVLTLCHYITPKYILVRWLLGVVNKYPFKVAEVLQLAVDYHAMGYEFYDWFDKGKVLLSKLLATEARETAIKTIHKLGAYGFNQFGVLLRDETDGKL